jgi:hypothetical protein
LLDVKLSYIEFLGGFHPSVEIVIGGKHLLSARHSEVNAGYDIRKSKITAIRLEKAAKLHYS